MRRKKEIGTEPVEEIVEEIKEEPIEKKKDIPEFYTLKIGQTLKDVAKKFGVDEKKLFELNGEVYGTNQVRLK